MPTTAATNSLRSITVSSKDAVMGGRDDYVDRDTLLYSTYGNVVKNGTLTLEVRIRPHTSTAIQSRAKNNGNMKVWFH
jgi:hypothetical protein